MYQFQSVQVPALGPLEDPCTQTEVSPHHPHATPLMMPGHVVHVV
jgi:hypothetical protein